MLGADEAVSADEGAGNVGRSCDRGEAGGVDGSCREEAVLGARWRACINSGQIPLGLFAIEVTIDNNIAIDFFASIIPDSVIITR